MPWDVILTVFIALFGLLTFTTAIQRRRRGGDMLSILFFVTVTALAVVVTIYRLHEYWSQPPAPIPATIAQPVAAPGPPLAGAAAPASPTPQQIGYGKTVADRRCSSCHQIAAEQPAPPPVRNAQTGQSVAAPSFIAIASDPKTTDATLRALLLQPHPPMTDVSVSVERADVPYLTSYILSLAAVARGH